MTEQSSLVERLRDGADDVNDEAADRIEELERQLSEWREMTAARDKRIAELEVEAAEAHIATVNIYQRLATLEAALREIAEQAGPITASVARRALEGKP